MDNKRNVQEVEVCIKLKNLNPFCSTFLVVDDANEYLLPKQLIFTKLNLKLVGQYESEDTNYIIWAVRVWKWQEKKFMDVVTKVINQMMVKGHYDYIEYCKNLIDNFGKEFSDSHKKE